MQDLTLVGVHDDGEHLVFSGSDGQRFRARVDEPLRAAVRRDRARLGQLQIEMAGRLRPRDIQARIRAGQTAEEIAESAGLPVEHVRRYEGPVLAEREFVVRQARAVRIRRHGGQGTGSATLGDLVAERLGAREVPEADSAWDAWRADDGAWLVVLTFTAGSRERRARWVYDAQLRNVTAQDDEARWLTEDEPAPSEPGPVRRLVPIRGHDPLRSDAVVHDRVYDVEADGGVRPADGGAGPAGPAVPAAAAGHPAGSRSSGSATVDLLDTLRERRGRRQRAATTAEGDVDAFESARAPGDPFVTDPPAIWSLDPPVTPGEPPPAHPPRSRPDLAADAEILALPDDHRAWAAPPVGSPVGSSVGSGLDDGTRVPGAGTGTDGEQPGASVPLQPVASTAQPVPSPVQAGAAAGSATARRGKRASVPSWDDIVFGSRRDAP